MLIFNFKLEPSLIDHNRGATLLAELISTPSVEFLLLRNVIDTKKRHFASSATRRDTVSTNALTWKAKIRSKRLANRNDDGMAALRTS
jgi:hypothetical protein